jgi:hypothetical protein
MYTRKLYFQIPETFFIKAFIKNNYSISVIYIQNEYFCSNYLFILKTTIMSKQIIEFPDLIQSLKDLQSVVSEQSEIQDDLRIKALSAKLKVLVAGPMFNSSTPSNTQSTGELGKIVKPSQAIKGSVDSGATVNKSVKLGEVVSKAEPAATELAGSAAKLTDKQKEDQEFLLSLKDKTVEKLASTQFSKDALIQIVKTINENSEAKIEFAAEDTKQLLAEKIHAALNPVAEPAATE